MDQLQSTDKKNKQTKSVNSLILLLALNVGGVSRYRTTNARGHSDIPDHNSILGKDLLYHELVKHDWEVTPIWP